MNTPLSKSKILSLLEANEQFMELLRLIDVTVPQPWCIFGGQLRNIVWDKINDSPKPHTSVDIDVGIFFPSSSSLKTTLKKKLDALEPRFDWDIENFAFSHIENQDDAYTSLEDGLEKQLMTVMSVGATLDNTGAVILITPLGIEDLVTCTVRPTPIIFEHLERKHFIEERLVAKQWQQKWPNLRVIL